MNSQEIDLYVALPEGLYLYEAQSNRLKPVLQADLREKTGQPYSKDASVVLIFVADLPRLAKAKADMRTFYAAFDAGCVSQNVYLYCASEGLATVVHDLDRTSLAQAMKLKPGQKIVIAQAVIATPIVTGITIGAIQGLPPSLRLQILALGATRRQLLWMLVREARIPLLAAVMAGFGGVISEVGASIMVGGNIRGQTRVLTTATVMETGKGNFDVAIALSAILLALTLAVNAALTLVQQRRRPR